jgi:hypothetical protein
MGIFTNLFGGGGGENPAPQDSAPNEPGDSVVSSEFIELMGQCNDDTQEARDEDTPRNWIEERIATYDRVIATERERLAIELNLPKEQVASDELNQLEYARRKLGEILEERFPGLENEKSDEGGGE